MRIRPKILIRFLCAFAGGALLPEENAQAGSDLGGKCNLDSANFVSVTIGNIINAAKIPITVPVNLTCDFDPKKAERQIGNPATGNRKVGFCWHFHNTPNKFQYRTSGMKGPTSDPYIRYNFYSKSNGLMVGGKGTVSDGQYNMIGWAEGSGAHYSMHDAVSLVFEGNEGAQLVPGQYKFNSTDKNGFHADMTAVLPNTPVDFSNPQPFCKSGDGAGGNNDISAIPKIQVNASILISVKTYCQFNTGRFQNISFGINASLKNVKPATGIVNVDCTAGTHYSVSVGAGLHDAGKQRYMKADNDGPGIAYDLSETSWEDYGQGTPAGIDRTITATILPNQPTPPDGIYKDTVVLTLTHITDPGDVPVDDTRVHNLN